MRDLFALYPLSSPHRTQTELANVYTCNFETGIWLNLFCCFSLWYWAFENKKKKYIYFIFRYRIPENIEVMMGENCI